MGRSRDTSVIAARVDRWRRILALCGILGPIIFTIDVIILALLRPGYSHLSQTISTLGEIGSTNAVAQDLNFFLLGALVIAFSVGLRRGIGGGRASRIGTALVGLFGVGVVLAGIFPCDQCSQFGNSAANTLHGLASIVAFFGFLPAPFPLSLSMRRNSAWQGYPRLSLVMGVLILIFLVAFLLASASPLQGAFQRLLVGAIFLYIALMAARLYRVSSTSGKVASSA